MNGIQRKKSATPRAQQVAITPYSKGRGARCCKDQSKRRCYFMVGSRCYTYSQGQPGHHHVANRMQYVLFRIHGEHCFPCLQELPPAVGVNSRLLSPTKIAYLISQPILENRRERKNSRGSTSTGKAHSSSIMMDATVFYCSYSRTC
jgi:hypothetical protein